MFRYLSVWERVSAIAGSWALIILATWNWLEGSPVVMSPAHFLVHTAAFLSALLLWTYERNRRQRTIVRGKTSILIANEKRRAAAAPKSRAFFQGAACGIGNFMVLDGQLDESEVRFVRRPDGDEEQAPTFEDGREEMARAFWASVCGSRADFAEKQAARAARDEAECRRLAVDYEAKGIALAVEELRDAATWHQKHAGEHAAEAAQLRSWAAGHPTTENP